MKKVFIFIFFASIIILLQNCIDAPEYPIEPVISFNRYSKNTMKQGFNSSVDQMEVVLNFTDGDGDFGHQEDGKPADVVIYDPRNEKEIKFYKIPFVMPQGVGNGINGEIALKLGTTCCIFKDGSIPCTPSKTQPTDTLRYKIWIFDRAGNKSNILDLPPIILECK